MAVFKPTRQNNSCILEFDNNIKYELPIHEEMLDKISAMAKKQLATLKSIDNESATATDEIYNTLLDAIDDILGDGAGADIMTIFNKPGILDAGEVIFFIVNEYRKAYGARLNALKADASDFVNEPPTADAKRGRR